MSNSNPTGADDPENSDAAAHASLSESPGNGDGDSGAATPTGLVAQSGPDAGNTEHRVLTEMVTLSEPRAAAWEEELRGRLGVIGRLPRTLTIRGWIAAAIAGLIAFVTRFWNLNHPHALVFDETYYVKGAFSLQRQGFEGVWDGDNVNDLFLQGDYSPLSAIEGDYVVHPPLGKWLMAIGQMLFGEDTGMGWRFTTAFFGVASVMLLVYIAMRLFRSPFLAGFAGVAMALDGMGITLARTGILDGILAFFTLAGFATLLLDRDDARAKLAHRTAHGRLRPNGTPTDTWGARIWSRPWMMATGLLLGMACGVKWSGIYAVAVFGLIAFAWGTSARKIVGAKLWFGAGVFREGIPAFISLVPVAFLTYIAAWIPWFANTNGYNRQWAQSAPAAEIPISWAPDAVNSLLHYHGSMWTFHNSLSKPHDYQSQAWDWLIQARPVSFFWNGASENPPGCGESGCVQAITSVGNPVIWWLGIVGLGILLWNAVRNRDWRAWAILGGYMALWMPWLGYTGRTIFQFYAVAVLPFVVLALTYGLAYLTRTLGRPRIQRLVWEDLERVTDSARSDGGRGENAVVVEKNDEPDPLFARFAPAPEHTKPAAPWWYPPAPDRAGYVAVGALTAMIVAAAIFWMPLWWGSTVSHSYWNLHMWFQSWI
ncbi:MAG: dolichyl-phosphate-mannose--protein mannosyltransferase [Ancrocorticia sp.]|uniref:dolichyl-phosphate-mannose--protein mannosyltransferase n=1 Tax=Ancrocorticia sp. TaxID=2593684 RepID=UPI003F92999A